MASIPLPEHGERVAMEDGRPSATWYRIWKMMFDAFNRTQGAVDSAETGLGTKAAKTQATGASFYIKFPEDGTERVLINSPFAWSAASITVRTLAGTVNVTPKVDGVAGSGGAIAASTTEATEESTASIAAGSDIELTFDTASLDCEGLAVMWSGTRQLD